MTTITDTQLRANAALAKGKVVIITGGANGLGKQAGSEFSRAGSKVVIGDLDMNTAAQTVEELKKYGGDVVAQRCDVTKWQDMVLLFQFAIDTYGKIDIVVANAGVGEIGDFDPFGESMVKTPSKPNMTTINVNTIGVIYTSRLAMFWFEKNPSDGKALILLGSVASLSGVPLGPMYTASKHAVLGIHRSLTHTAPPGTRVCLINPWFADTAILEKEIRLILKGLAFVPVPRIGAAIFCAATDPDVSTNGCAYVLPDNGEVFRIDAGKIASLDEDCYALLRNRINEQARHPKALVFEP